MQSSECLDRTLSLSPFTLYLAEKIWQKGEEKETGGGRTRDECVELLKRDGLCLCACVAEGGLVVPCPVQH